MSTIFIPEYYETALKVKYNRGEVSAMMIDIIHDNFGVTFPFAYSTSLNNFLMFSTFSTPLTNKSTDFMSNYDKLESAALTKLETMVQNPVEKQADLYRIYRTEFLYSVRFFTCFDTI